MIIEAPLLLSGVTASPGQSLATGEIISGISISPGQTLANAQVISGSSFCAGQKLDNVVPKYPPDIFKLVFGENASQDTSSLKLIKNNFSALTAKDNNTAESLLVALLVNNISQKNKIIYTPRIDFQYWGRGFDGNQQIDTIIISVYNLLPTTDTYEISDYTSNVNPMDY